MSDEQRAFYYLGVALALGLLIGVERGWKTREEAEGQRVAGVRTYGLIGLLGGGAALLGQSLGPLVTGLMFLGLAGALTAVYVANLGDDEDDVGITSLVAGLLTFLFGALAGLGEVAVAGA
ncbi:MAG: MgtC/SapB family protein, partial [Gammaproteobacteria bacterium]